MKIFKFAVAFTIIYDSKLEGVHHDICKYVSPVQISRWYFNQFSAGFFISSFFISFLVLYFFLLQAHYR